MMNESVPESGGAVIFRRILHPLVAWGSLVSLSGCRDSEGGPHSPVGIGVVLPLTGDLQGFGEDVKKGIELAFHDLSPASVPLVFRDDRADPVRSADIVHELAASPRIVAIVGSVTSDCCLAAAERAQALKVPLLTPTATTEAITQNRDWVFRTCFTDPQQGKRMARFAREKRLERVAIAKDVTNDYSVGLAEAFATTFLRLGGELEEEIAYRRGKIDPARMREWLAQSPCDAIFLPGYVADVAQILNATYPVWRERRVVFLGGDGWDSPELRERVAHWPEEVYITNHFAPDDDVPEVAKFVDDYRRMYGADATPSSLAALAYDTGVFLAQVLRSGGSNREGFRKAVRESLQGFRGVTGAVVFDPSSNELVKEVPVVRWSGNRWSLDRRR
jgi:branched-chain amino acid transport system substrate-binding protein